MMKILTIVVVFSLIGSNGVAIFNGNMEHSIICSGLTMILINQINK